MAADFVKYGLLWTKRVSPIEMEMEMLRRGGKFKTADGRTVGLGLLFHFRQFMAILWPWIKWHAWALMQLEAYVNHRIIGQMGPASTGKSFILAACVTADYYLYSHCTTVIVSSTTRESLEMRVWGEIKKLHRSAKGLHPWLPGFLIEGRQRIVSDPREEAKEGRDFRNGIVGVACKKGQTFQGLEEYVGIKNDRLRLLADELQFLPRSFIDAFANLNKNPDFKGIGNGNPKDTTDALGTLCEPAPEVGGWDGGMDQKPGSKTWPIKFPGGICIQLWGPDSPNLDGKLGIPLITQEQIDADIKFYGKESLQYTMMDEGRMPRGLGLRRVLTRQVCLKFQALEEPVWSESALTKIAFLDAAYRGIGGDRCIFGELDWGKDTLGNQILALADIDVVPITQESNDSPEDQIVKFVMAQCMKRGIPPENFFFDSTGRGTLMAAFARLWSPNVQPVEFGGPPTDRPVSAGIDIKCSDHYSKFVTELWYSVRLVVEAGQFRGMTEEVMQEFCMREWELVGSGGKSKIEVERKEKTKLKLGRSPDLADAVATGVEGARRRGFQISRMPGMRRVGQMDEWKKQLKERAAEFWKTGALTYR